MQWPDINFGGALVRAPSNTKQASACECLTHCATAHPNEAKAFSWVDPERYTGSAAYHGNCHCRSHPGHVKSGGYCASASPYVGQIRVFSGNDYSAADGQ